MTDLFSTTTGVVTDTMASMKAVVDSHIVTFDEVVDELSNIHVDSTSFAQPDMSFGFTPPPLQAVDTSPIDYQPFNIATGPLPTAPDFTGGFTTPPTVVMPDAPIMEAINIPAPPTHAAVSLPARPAIDAVSVPDAPTLNMPIAETLSTITLPTFVAPVLPTFNESVPLLDAVAPDVAMRWVEPTYTSENFDNALATIDRMRLGGTGLPAAIEQQLFERARSREARVAQQQTQEVFDTFAARGFVAPPGVLQNQLALVQERHALQVNALQREVMIKATDVELENLRFSVTQGLAAEQILVSIFENASKRAFEMARFTVESLLALYNTKVSIFNALMQAYQTKAQVYKTIVEGQLATLESYRLQLEGAKVSSEINQQRVQTYTAQVQAVLAYVELHKAQLQGVMARVEIAKTSMEAYRTDVQAYAETIGAEKTKFEAYRAQVEGEVAKGQVNQSRASMFTTLVQGEVAKVGVWRAQAETELAKIQAKTSGYVASIEGYRAGVQAQVSSVQASSEILRSEIAGVSAHNTAVIEANRAAISLGEMRVRSNIAKAETSVKLYDVNLTKLIQTKNLHADSLKAAGQMLSTVVGGAMAAQHTQVSMGVTGQDQSSRIFNNSHVVTESDVTI